MINVEVIFNVRSMHVATALYNILYVCIWCDWYFYFCLLFSVLLLFYRLTPEIKMDWLVRNYSFYFTKGLKVKGPLLLLMVHHITARGRHLPYGITQCYTCHLTQANAPHLSSSRAGWYSIYLPRWGGRLSWPSWLDSAPAGSRTSDLSITSPTPNRCTTKTTSDVLNYYLWHYERLLYRAM